MSVPASVSELELRGRLPGRAMMHAELAMWIVGRSCDVETELSEGRRKNGCARVVENLRNDPSRP